jgi:hypothetical protein
MPARSHAAREKRMAHRKAAKPVRRRVWRVTQNAPHGEYVDVAVVTAADLAGPAPRREDQGWLVSSFELTHGLDVSDETDTLPGELFDQLFTKR